jgi:hypothetical protein
MSDPTSPKLTDDPWQKTRFQADGVGDAWVGTRGHCRLLAHYDRLLTPDEPRLLEIGFVRGQLLTEWPALGFTGVDCFRFQVDQVNSHLPQSDFQVKAGEQLTLEAGLDVVIISDALDEAMDVGQLHEPVQAVYSPETRPIFNYHSNLWDSLFTAAHRLGLRRKALQSDLWVTADAKSLPDLSAWDVAQLHHFLVAADRGRLGSIIDHYPALIHPLFCLTVSIAARSRGRPAASPARALSASVVGPARNEAGSIAGAVARTPTMSEDSNLIFERGYSRDDTWTRIQKVAANHPPLKIEALRPSDRGKGDAELAELAAAASDVLTALEADPTTPHEELPKVYEVIASGKAELADGVSLIYPTSQRAMQFLYLRAKNSFGLIFSWLLCPPAKDTLWGTEVLRRAQYENIAANRTYFGDFDPLGDFDLGFGAATQNLKIADTPIRHRERTHGETNIQRRRHGWLLLRTVIFPPSKLKFT